MSASEKMNWFVKNGGPCPRCGHLFPKDKRKAHSKTHYEGERIYQGVWLEMVVKK